MTATEMFNFVTFKSVMEVSDIDEATYSFTLRAVFTYLKKIYGIDLLSTQSFTLEAGSTASSLIVPYDPILEVGQLVDGKYEITAVSSDPLLTLSTIIVTPSYTMVPSTISVLPMIIQYDLQHAIFQHTKFLFESQKKNTYIIDSVTDANGNKATYKSKLPSYITAVYAEYSDNLIAFS